MASDLQALIQETQKILDNFKKTPNRAYSSEYLLGKQIHIKNTRETFKTKYAEVLKIDQDQAVSLKNKFEAIYKQISDIIDNKSKIYLENNSESKTLKMASFEITTAIKVIPEFKGQLKELSNFLNIIEFLHDTLKDNDEKVKLIKFVIKTRLSENVKNKLITFSEPTNLTSLKTILHEAFKPKKTALSIQSEMAKSFQGNRGILDFSEKIETLMSQLNTIQISEQGETHREIIVKLNEQIALNAFKNGLNEPMKSTVFASRPSKLQDAIQVASDLERPSTQAKVLHYKKYNKPFNFNRNQNSNIHASNNSNFNRSRNFNMTQNKKRYPQRSDNNNTFTQRNNGNRPNLRHNNNNRRVNTVTSGNAMAPESETGINNLFQEQ